MYVAFLLKVSSAIQLASVYMWLCNYVVFLLMVSFAIQLNSVYIWLCYYVAFLLKVSFAIQLIYFSLHLALHTCHKLILPICESGSKFL